MKVNTALLKKISKGKPKAENVNSIVIALNDYGERFGLSQPHRLAHYLAQLGHESGGFFYDREIASGAAYENRKDLGNTQAGDGKKFKGRTGIQITGRANYRAFTKWVRKFIPDAPDFEKNPDLVNTDPYEGLVGIWYWDEGNPDPKGRSLNYYADQNNIEMVTRRINGGLNGYQDRIEYYDRAALALLGYGVKDTKKFQTDAKERGRYKSDVDGVSGPLTRTALHLSLIAMTNKAERADDIQVAPITEKVIQEKKVEVPVEVETPVVVAPPSLDKPFYKDPDFLEKVGTGGFLTTMTGFFTNIPTDKLLIMVAILIAGGVVWYVIRSRRVAKLEARAAVIDTKAAVTRAAIAADQP